VVTIRGRTFGHRVDSGPWPLYRIMALMFFCGAVTQAIKGPPVSVATTVPSWFDPVYVTFTLAATSMIVIAIGIMRETLRAAYIERMGLILLFGAMVLYIIPYILTYGVPGTPTAWTPIGFLIYCPLRYRELGERIKATELLRRMPRESRGHLLNDGES
jgi:hypothetical protein